jgi:hypothetical protein
MEDFSVSTETSAPDVSASNDVATATSSAGAITEPSGTQTPTDSVANAPEAAASEFDAGWSLDEDATPEADVIPDDDSDIPESIDPREADRVQGVVGALRNARQHARELAKEVKQYRQTVEALDSYGGAEAATQTLGLIHGFLNPQPDETGAVNDSTVPFLESIYGASAARYERLVSDVVEQHADYVVERLQALGKLPADLGQQNYASSIDADMLNATPEHLRDAYKALPQSLRDQYDALDPEARQTMLERDKKLMDIDNAQRSAQEQQQQQAYQSAVQKGQTQAQELLTSFEKAHYAQLQKWSPYGPEQSKQNNQLYRNLVEGAFSQLLENQEYAAMYQDANDLLRNAPIKALAGEKFAAQEAERQARNLATRFNARLGQEISAQVKAMDEVFRGYRAWREQQRSLSPNRTEIPGQMGGVALQQNRNPNAVDSSGRVTDEYKRVLSRMVEDNLRSGRS